MVWSEGTNHFNYKIFYARRTAQGWSGRQQVSQPTQTSPLVVEVPDVQHTFVAVASDGKVHIIWTQYTNPSNWTGNVHHAVYLNGSRIFGPQNISSGTPKFASYSPDLTAGLNGAVHVVWWGTDSPFSFEPKGEAYHRRWNGSSWESITLLSEGQNRAMNPTVAVDAADTVHVAWHQAAPTSTKTALKGEIHYRNRPAGQGWGSIERVSDGQADAWIDSALTGGKPGEAYLTWLDQSAGQGLVYAHRGSGSWSAQKPITSDIHSTAFGPQACRMAYGPGFGAHLTFMSAAPNLDIMYTQLDRGQVTKHYFTDGQRLATRVGDDLYYLLPDPSGRSTTFVDHSGAQTWHTFTDPYGGVITNTLPLTLTEQLAGNLDAAAGLQFDGLRFYDPLVGSFVQPSPFGGMPGMPQGLNRYNVASGVVASGVLATSSSSLQGDLLFGVLSVSANKAAGYYAKQVSERGATSLLRPRFAGYGAHRSPWGTLSFQGSRGRFQQEGLLGFFDVSDPIQYGYGGRSLFNSLGFVEQVGENVYRTATGEIIDLNSLGYGSNLRWLRNINFRAEMVPYSKLRYPLGNFAPVARSVLGEALPFGIDSAFQLATDWNTEMPVGHRFGRVGVSATVGVTSGILTGAALTWAWGAAGLAGGPPAWAVIGAGIIVGITVEQKTSDSINDVLFPIDR